MKIQFLSIAVALALVTLTASAQRPEGWARTDEPTVLARMGLLEAGENVPGTELAAMKSVIEHRATRNRGSRPLSFHSAAWAFSRGLRNPDRAWVHNLRRGMTINNPRMQAYWNRIMADSDAVFAGDLLHNCVDDLGHAVSPVDWGGPVVDRGTLDALKRRNGWRTAVCPGAKNEYLYNPSN